MVAERGHGPTLRGAFISDTETPRLRAPWQVLRALTEQLLSTAGVLYLELHLEGPRNRSSSRSQAGRVQVGAQQRPRLPWMWEVRGPLMGALRFQLVQQPLQVRDQSRHLGGKDWRH